MMTADVSPLCDDCGQSDGLRLDGCAHVAPVVVPRARVVSESALSLRTRAFSADIDEAASKRLQRLATITQLMDCALDSAQECTITIPRGDEHTEPAVRKWFEAHALDHHITLTERPATADQLRSMWIRLEPEHRDIVRVYWNGSLLTAEQVAR